MSLTNCCSLFSVEIAQLLLSVSMTTIYESPDVMMISSFLGSGTSSNVDGYGTSASLSNIASLCLDEPHNLLYVICDSAVKKVNLATVYMTNLSKYVYL